MFGLQQSTANRRENRFPSEHDDRGGLQGRGVLVNPHRQVEATSQQPASAVTHRSVRPTLTLQGGVQWRHEASTEVSDPRIVPLVLWCAGTGEPRTGAGGLSKVLHKTPICWKVENAAKNYPSSCGMNSEPTERVEVKRTSTVGRWESAIELKGIDLENNGDYYFETFTVTMKLILPLSFGDGSTCMQGKCSTTDSNPYFLLHIIRQTRTLLFLTGLELSNHALCPYRD